MLNVELPFLNVTIPVDVEGDTLAVKLTALPTSGVALLTTIEVVVGTRLIVTGEDEDTAAPYVLSPP